MLTHPIIVIKIGGEIIHHPDNLNLLCHELAKLKQANMHIILVHGGGLQVNQLETKLGHIPNILNGRRITDIHALNSIKMVIGGKMNIEIVGSLQSHEVCAIGLTGVDNNLLSVCKRPVQSIDYGFVGDIQAVNTQFLFTLLAQNLTPVIAPLAADKNGIIYNINADTVASAITLALKANQWIILTNTDGIYDEQGHTIAYLSYDQAREFIAQGIIKDGMLPKIEAILSVINSGIKTVHIINGFKPEKLSNLSDEKSLGTLITREQIC